MAQFIRPNSDISTGTFSPTPLHTRISDISDTTTVISDNNTSSDFFECGMSSADPPQAGTLTFKIRWQKAGGTGGHSVNPSVQLLDAQDNVLATLSSTNAELDGQGFITLTTTSVVEPSSWTGLHILTGGDLGNGGAANTRRALEVAWAELEIPDAFVPDEIFGSSTQPAAATIAVGGYIEGTGSAALSSSAILSSGSVAGQTGSALLQSSAVVTSFSDRETFGQASSLADASVAIAGKVEFIESALIQSVASLDASGTPNRMATASLASSATMSSDGGVVILGSTVMSASASTLASQFVSRVASVTLSSAAAQVAASAVEVFELSALSSTATKAVAGFAERFSTGSMVASALTAFNGIREVVASLDMRAFGFFDLGGIPVDKALWMQGTYRNNIQYSHVMRRSIELVTSREFVGISTVNVRGVGTSPASRRQVDVEPPRR